MINVSNAFKKKIAEGYPVIEEVDITFSDGTVKTVNKEILNSGNDIVDGVDGSSFPIGQTVCKSIQLSLDNSQEQWKNYCFYGAKLRVKLKMELDDGTVETIDRGTFTVTTPEEYGEDVELTALDDMYKANKTYTTSLAFPQDAYVVLQDACQRCGISLGTGSGSMEHATFPIQSVPDGMTFRDVIGCIAMIESANARIDNNGYLQLVKWDFSGTDVDNAASVDSDGFLKFGGGSDVDSDSYISPAGDWMINSDGYLYLNEGVNAPQRLRDYISSPMLSTDDIVITGIQVKNGDKYYQYGSDEYVLSIENSLLQTDQLHFTALFIGDILIGKKFRGMEGDLLFNPLIEFGDMVRTYDRKENVYITPITYVASGLNGTTTVKTQAESPIRGSSTYNSDSLKTLIQAKKLVEAEKNARELAVGKLEEAMKNASGLYETPVVQEDGSTITYLHDKPTLAESKTIIKFTAEAIGVSNDGGKTYPYGFILDGSLITRLLYAEGINADYILFGTLKGIKLEAVTGDITGEFTSASTNSWGKEYVKIKDAIISAGLDGTQKSLIDMVAQYEDGLHLVIKNDTEINIEAPVLKILTDILNISNGRISITQKDLSEAQVNVANTGISGRLVASGGGNFGLYNTTSGSWVIKSSKTGDAILPYTVIEELNVSGQADFDYDVDVTGTINNKAGIETDGAVSIGKSLNVNETITTYGKINLTKSDLSEAQIDISNSDISGRLTASAAKNFGLYHITFSKWLIRMGSDGNAYLLDTIFNGKATFNKGAIFAGTAIFSKSATFNATANFEKPPKLYNLTNVTSGNHLVMASDGASIAYLSSSSLRYKDVQGAVEEADLESLYQIKVVWAKYKNEYLDASDERYGKEMPMFLAEDVDQHFPLAVDHDEQGRAENWNYRIMIPCMFAMLKNEHEKVKELQFELELIKTELAELKEFVNQYIVKKEV